MIGRIVGRIRREISELRARIARVRRYFRVPLLPTIQVVISTIFREMTSPRDSRIRVGVDIRPFYEPLTGVGWYLFHILEEFSKHPDLELFYFGESMLGLPEPRLHASLPAGGHVVGFNLQSTELSRWSRPITAAFYPLLAKATRCDVFFGANYFLPRALDAVATRRVVTVHDLTFRRFPELLQKETLANLERKMLREVARADRIVCVSEATRSELLHFYEIDPLRAVTVLSGHAALPIRRDPVPLPQGKYILFVSTIEPRKDLDTLLEAFDAVAEDGTYSGSLVVVGKIGWKAEQTVAKMKSMRHSARIHHLDYLSRSQLATVYSQADLFVLPSIYEGFGFPILEAMSFGVPTIATRSSSLPEVGGAAALYFPVGDATVLAHLIGLISHDEELRHALSARGRDRAASFSWTRAAVQTAAVLRAVARSA